MRKKVNLLETKEIIFDRQTARNEAAKFDPSACFNAL